jgi:hypothetical protein
MTFKVPPLCNRPQTADRVAVFLPSQVLGKNLPSFPLWLNATATKQRQRTAFLGKNYGVLIK